MVLCEGLEACERCGVTVWLVRRRGHWHATECKCENMNVSAHSSSSLIPSLPMSSVSCAVSSAVSTLMPSQAHKC